MIALSTGFSRYPWKAELSANTCGGLNFLRLIRKLFKASVRDVMMRAISIDAYLSWKWEILVFLIEANRRKIINMLHFSILHFNQMLQLENEHLPDSSQIKLRSHDFS